MTDYDPQKIDELEDRLENVEAENQALREELDETSAGPSVTRRGAMGVLGGAAGAALLGGATGSAAATHADEYTGAHGVHYVTDGDKIQDALNAAPGSNWYDPAHVVVTPEYDSSIEDFPVDIRRRAVIQGSNYAPIKNDDDAVDTFQIDIGGDGSDVGNRPPGVFLKDLTIKGGNHGINVIDGRYNAFHNVDVNDVATDAYHFSDGSRTSAAINSHKMVSCFSDSPGRHNVYCGSEAHGVIQVGCQHYFAGGRGVKIASGNYNSKMIGSGVEQAQEYGLEIEGSVFGVYGGYFEDNFQSADPGEAEIQTSGNPDGFVIRNCYFQGLDNVEYAIRTFNGGSGIVEGCTFTNYTDSFIYLDDSIDVDARRESHTALDDTAFGGYTDAATRPRSYGVIGAQHADGGMNLSGVSGKFPGDRGLDDGTNTEYGTPDLCVWTGSEWRQVGTGNTFT